MAAEHKRTARNRLLLGLYMALAAAAAVFTGTHHRFLTPTPIQLQRAFPGDTRQILEQSSQFTLFSLEPNDFNQPGKKQRPAFHGRIILGQITLDSRQKQEVLRAFYDGIARNGPPASCFFPRHGIRAIAGKKSIDLLICFHCHQFYVSEGAKDQLSFVSDEPQNTSNRILSDAGVALARS